jgi:hypothetical protein
MSYCQRGLESAHQLQVVRRAVANSHRPGTLMPVEVGQLNLLEVLPSV